MKNIILTKIVVAWESTNEAHYVYRSKMGNYYIADVPKGKEPTSEDIYPISVSKLATKISVFSITGTERVKTDSDDIVVNNDNYIAILSSYRPHRITDGQLVVPINLGTATTPDSDRIEFDLGDEYYRFRDDPGVVYIRNLNSDIVFIHKPTTIHSS